MAAKRSADQNLHLEFVVAFAIGAVVAWAVPPTVFDRIDDMVMIYISIVVAAAVPGLALTAAAPRPHAQSVRDARQIGTQLSDQVRFWLGFLGWGSLAVVTVIIGHGCKWQWETLRPSFIPTWVPHEGGRWLMLAATTAVVFTGIRTRRVVRAVLDLIALGTTNQIDEVATRRQEETRALAEQISTVPKAADRGQAIDRPH